MPQPDTDASKEKEQRELCLDLFGASLDLGKKISVPQDLMMEELNLLSNRGSIMFHERLKRVERFTWESTADGNLSNSEKPVQATTPAQAEKGRDDITTGIYIGHPGKNSLVHTLRQTVAWKGNPSVLAPGYGGPLKEIPPEKFNITVIPKSYRSPWEEKSIDCETLLVDLSTQLSEAPYKLTPANYKCFNRAPAPFGGTAGTSRALPLPGFELQQAHTEPCLTWDRMCHRPDFNRTPRGWRMPYTVESPDL
ncbi:hypothetical protein DNTS_021784 [Danionella cerebrum]|uniref:Uncharacterized protein n=1 Tax=Danionella cerebrum TaxID=2873325 RepID=A0A553R852_9TELE|nr:hypothetical protein DNTS_021784 [Danionella translucida]